MRSREGIFPDAGLLARSVTLAVWSAVILSPEAQNGC